MRAFINGLKVIYPNINIQSTVNGENDPILRFFDLNPTYLQYKNHGAWINELHKYKFRDPSYINNLSSILHLKTTSLNEKLNLCNTLYNINCNSYNIYFNSLFREFLNNQTLDYFWSNNNIRNYFEKGPGSTDNIAVNIAYPLLENIISTTNNALAHEEIGGTFRFAHAETLIPFAALINLCNYGIQYNTYTQINSNWKDYLIARMAANIQFIFYTCTNKPPLVTVLLNENYATLPLRSSNHFYEWSEVEHYFYNILDNLNIPSSNGTLTSF